MSGYEAWVEDLPPDAFRHHLLAQMPTPSPEEDASFDQAIVAVRNQLAELDVDVTDPAQLHAAAMGSLYSYSCLDKHTPGAEAAWRTLLRVMLLAADLPTDLGYLLEPTAEPTAEPTEGPPADLAGPEGRDGGAPPDAPWRP